MTRRTLHAHAGETTPKTTPETIAGRDAAMVSDPTPDPAADHAATAGDPAGAADHIGGGLAAAAADPLTAGFKDHMDAKRDQLAEGLRIFVQGMARPVSVSEAAAQLQANTADVTAAAEASEFLRIVDEVIAIAA